jgi:hypothetical protein
MADKQTILNNLLISLERLSAHYSALELNGLNPADRQTVLNDIGTIQTKLEQIIGTSDSITSSELKALRDEYEILVNTPITGGSSTTVENPYDDTTIKQTITQLENDLNDSKLELEQKQLLDNLILYNYNEINTNSKKINSGLFNEFVIPIEFNHSLLPNLRIWQSVFQRKFDTNIRAKKLFEDIFADKIVYVDLLTGNDGNDGSKSSPFKTIYNAVRVKPLGSVDGGKLTVYIKSGEYIDSNSWNATGIFADMINVIAYDGFVISKQNDITKYNGQMQDNKKCYIEGVKFIGGKGAFNFTNVAVSNTLHQFKWCAFNGSIAENGLNVRQNGVYILEECVSTENWLDGLNYHNYSLDKNQLVIEINCFSFNNGLNGGLTNNASTTHDEGNILRINGVYMTSTRPIHDIGACRSLNMGCIIKDTTLTDGPNITCGTIVEGGDFSIMWLISCDSSGTEFSHFAYPSSKIYIYDLLNTAKNFTVAGDIIPYSLI